MDEIAYWLALLRAPGIGPVRYRALLAHYRSPRAVLEAATELGRSARDPEPPLTAAAIRYLAAPDWRAVDQDLDWLARPGHHALTLQDVRYPPLLLQIHDPPPVLFVQGDPTCLATLQLALVGSRNPSPSGRELAAEFAAELARHGLTITSGLALGIDAAGHRGALSAEGATIAVTATGLDRVYPRSHRELAATISERGALVSEFPLGSAALAEHFPRRNRIISGLSLGTLVVEAALRSGSLITARSALEQGREVFAIPGPIRSPLARGCHALIRNGAKLVETVHDILEELGPLAAAARAAPAPSAKPGGAIAGLDPAGSRVLESIDRAPATVDLLVARTGYPAERLCPILLELELAGYIMAAAGGTYVRTERN